MKQKKTFICRICRKRVSGIYEESYQPVFCNQCNRIRQKKTRGRNGEEMKHLRQLPPVKVFSKQEIAQVAHLMTPPKAVKKEYLRADLY